jgi:hypothetical protein
MNRKKKRVEERIKRKIKREIETVKKKKMEI